MRYVTLLVLAAVLSCGCVKKEFSEVRGPVFINERPGELMSNFRVGGQPSPAVRDTSTGKFIPALAFQQAAGVELGDIFRGRNSKVITFNSYDEMDGTVLGHWRIDLTVDRYAYGAYDYNSGRYVTGVFAACLHPEDNIVIQLVEGDRHFTPYDAYWVPARVEYRERVRREFAAKQKLGPQGPATMDVNISPSHHPRRGTSGSPSRSDLPSVDGWRRKN
jgi:hypothetical protein